jgi:hypothetical protein
MSSPAQARPDAVLETRSTHPTEEDIAALAYALWQQRGSPDGSPDSDWLRAETILFGEPIAQEEP